MKKNEKMKVIETVDQETLIAGWFCAVILILTEITLAIATITAVPRFSQLTVAVGIMALLMTLALKFRENGEQMRAAARACRGHSHQQATESEWHIAA